MSKGALAGLDDFAAIDEIASGTLTKHIAERYGVRKQSLQERLSKHPEYAQAVKDQASSLVENVTAEVLSDDFPASMPVIARARLRLEAVHKWAAARDPATWSGKSDVSANITVQVLQFVADSSPQSPNRSPVALGLVDSEGDKSASPVVVEVSESGMNGAPTGLVEPHK